MRAAKHHAHACYFLLKGEVVLFSLVSYLFSLKEIEEYPNEYIDIPKGWFVIGYFYEDLIIIDTNRNSSGNTNYLLVNDCCCPFDNAKPLNSNFEIWFDRVIISQGYKFWTWQRYNANNYYKLCR